jgi:hypothetical protein
MSRGPLKPAHCAIKAHYECLAGYADQHVAHAGALRSAFQRLLAETSRAHGWTLIPELGTKAAAGVNGVSAATRTAVPRRGKREVFRADLRQPPQLCDPLNQFYAYIEPDIADFEQAAYPCPRAIVLRLGADHSCPAGL